MHANYALGLVVAGKYGKILMIEPAVLEKSFSTFACSRSNSVTSCVADPRYNLFYICIHAKHILNYKVKMCCC